MYFFGCNALRRSAPALLGLVWWSVPLTLAAAPPNLPNPPGPANLPAGTVPALVPVAPATPLALAAPPTLAQAFAQAWARQPEGQSLDLRRQAAQARRQAAQAWTAEPPVLEMSGQSDRLLKNQGSREYAAGVALPLWLPGEREGTAALAEAESRVVDSRSGGARLRLAGQLRAAWWAWLGQQAEQQLAQARLESASRLAADVARRVRAGDLARADLHQAEGARASAAAALAESDRALAGAARELRAIVGGWPEAPRVRMNGSVSATLSVPSPEPEPWPALPDAGAGVPEGHPALAEWRDRAELARQSAELARLQTRGNPELVLSTARERGAFEEGWQRNLTVGVRIPIGSEARHQARLGLARAEALEAERLGQLEQERLEASREASRHQVDAVRRQLEAATERARLAGETRQFFDKSFRLGESDLPTRLRIELEAVEAERQAARARIALAAAISDLRQALGLLPE